MMDFHDTAQTHAEAGETALLFQVAKAYEFWRHENPEPFCGADITMADIITNYTRNRAEAH